MTKIYKIEKARKPNPVVSQADIDRANAGEKGAASYYMWKFRYGGPRYSKSYPSRSQTTQSDFLGQVYDIEDNRIGGLSSSAFETVEELEQEITSIVDDLRALGNEQGDKLSNMPDSLQQGPTGELLQNRVDSIEDMASSLESVDYSEFDPENEDEKGEEESQEEYDARIETARQERIQEVIEEVQGISYEGE